MLGPLLHRLYIDDLDVNLNGLSSGFADDINWWSCQSTVEYRLATEICMEIADGV